MEESETENEQQEPFPTEDVTGCLSIVVAFLYNIRTMFDEIWKEEEGSKYQVLLLLYIYAT